MKKFVYALSMLLLASGAFHATGQALDMSLTSSNVTPTPALYPGTAAITFNVTAEILDQPLSSDDLSNSFASITIALSDLQGSALVMPTGAGADLFTWTYDAGSNSYTGFSRDVTMTADMIYPITLSGLSTTQVTTANTVGFIANLNPPGSLLASESNDDAVSIYTRADLNLPVTLVSFNAAKEGGSVMLTWATTEETNSDYFEVQHSVNGKNWDKIGMVKSHGESTVLRNYNFTHGTPAGGENMYRLRMVDLDQTYAYSSIRSVSLENAAVWAYPNPATDRLHFKQLANIQHVTLYNAMGNQVLNAQKVPVEGIDVSRLTAGIYTVALTLFDGTISTHKVAVTR